MFGCCPRHQVRMLVPERGEPTTKIGLLIGVAADESISYSWRNNGLRPFILPKNFLRPRVHAWNKVAHDLVHYCSFERRGMIGGSAS